MKKILLIFSLLLATQSVYAYNITGLFDKGGIYSGSSFPVDVAKDTDINKPHIEDLKYGEASTNNILGIIETGDRGVQKAAQNGGITKIHYIDTKVNKVYIPLGFIPIYVKQTTTMVYGE